MLLPREAVGCRLLMTASGQEHWKWETKAKYVFFPEGRCVLAKSFLKQEIWDQCHILHPLIVSISSILEFSIGSKQEAPEEEGCGVPLGVWGLDPH